MVCTAQFGAATTSGSKAYAGYLIKTSLEHTNSRAAEYYVGGSAGRDFAEPAIMLSVPSPAMSARLGINLSRPLTLDEVSNLMNIRTADGQDIEGRKKHSPHQSVAEVFGLDAKRMPTVAEIENVLAGKRVDGSAPAIEDPLPLEEPTKLSELGREVHEGKTTYSEALAELMQDALRTMPADADINEIELRLGEDLAAAAGRADVVDSGPRMRELSDKAVASAVRQFMAAIGVPSEGDVTAEQIQRVADGRIDQAEYRNQITQTSPPTGFVDLTFSADKSVSICYALAETEAERQIILSAFQAAVDDTMNGYASDVLGYTRRGAGGKTEQKAEICSFGVQHYTARPATDVIRIDANGEQYTDTRAVPGGTADVALHQHRIILSTVMTEDGHVGAIDLTRIKGEVKTLGAVFHASFATRLRSAGIKTELGPNGEARISGIPDWVRKFHSRRSMQGEEAARNYAKSIGQNWDTLDGDRKVALLAEGGKQTRRDKRAQDEGPGDIAAWQEEAKAAGYNHKSALGTLRPGAALTDEQRIEVARETSLKLLDEAFRSRAILTAGDLREIAARGFVVAGIGSNAKADIESVTKTFRERGVIISGEKTELVWGTETGINGRKQTIVTTGKALAAEEGVTELVQAAARDKSKALTAEQIDQAAERFLAAHPKIDRDDAQWNSQLAMAHQIGQGARVTLSIGVAGSGKTSSVVATLVDAWHQDGRTVYGMTVPWKASSALRDAGVDQALAIDAFVRRVQTGKIKIDSNTVIVADEVSQIGIRQQLALLKLAAQSGAQLVEIGDPRQCQAVETPAIELMCKTIGDESIPKLLTTIRQKTEEGRAVATMFRDGKAAEAIDALNTTGQFHLVPGGKDATIQHTADLWRTLTDANKGNPDYSLLVMTPTNAQALAVGHAIRANRREAGELGQTDTPLEAIDPNSGEKFALPVAVGDKLRMFTRTHDADSPGRKKVLSSNGDVVEVREVLKDGLRIRNEAGDEGRVTWSQMKPFRAPKNDPVRVTYGYAVTIDTAQSLTRSAAIVAMPDGSSQVPGYKAYTGLSRHVQDVHLVASDGAERKAIVKRDMLGLAHTPSRTEVIRNIGENLSRFEPKSQATEALRKAINVKRGCVGEMRAALHSIAKQQQSPELQGPSLYERMQLAPVTQRIVEMAHQVQQQAQNALKRSAAAGQNHTQRQQQKDRGHEMEM